MTDETKREPVDNSHRDAGIAAREAQKEASSEAVVEAVQDVAKQAAESAVDSESDDGDEGGSQNEGESADPGSNEPAKPKNRGVGKRIDELTKARHDAERDRDYWREQAVKLQAPQQETPNRSQRSESDEPTLESCDFDQAEFQRKWYSWRRDADTKAEAAQAKQRSFHDAEAKFRAEHPDYDAVSKNPALPITPQVAEVILDSDNPPAVAYYLGQNPHEAAEIAQMTPHQIGRAIGRIEAKLTAPVVAPAVAQPEPKTVSKAPAPVTNLSGSPAVHKSLADMSMREYDAQRRKDRLAKGLSP